jgi:hypothetical protein
MVPMLLDAMPEQDRTQALYENLLRSAAQHNRFTLMSRLMPHASQFGVNRAFLNAAQNSHERAMEILVLGNGRLMLTHFAENSTIDLAYKRAVMSGNTDAVGALLKLFHARMSESIIQDMFVVVAERQPIDTEMLMVIWLLAELYDFYPALVPTVRHVFSSGMSGGRTDVMDAMLDVCDTAFSAGFMEKQHRLLSKRYLPHAARWFHDRREDLHQMFNLSLS